MSDATLFQEIEIRGEVMPRAMDQRTVYETHLGFPLLGSECVSAPAVTATIDDAQARGVSVLLLRLDSTGGHAQSGVALYERLRRFSREGGTVVVYVEGDAGSSAVLLGVAGDFVVMAPFARFVCHSARMADGGDPAKMNDSLIAVLESRTASTRRTLERAHRDPFVHVEVRPEKALRLGWADYIGSLDQARELAAAIAAGARPVTPRARMIAARPEVAARCPSAPATAMITDARLGLSQVVVRIESVEEDDDHNLQITALEWPFGVGHAVSHDTASSDGPPIILGPEASERVLLFAVRNLVARTAPAPYTAGDPMDVYAVIYANNQWVIAGGETSSYAYPFVSRSYDGSTWSTVYPPNGVYNNGVRGIVWNGTTYVAVSYGRAWTSPDAITWTQRAIGSYQWNAVEWDGSQHVAVGQRISTSPDGVTWTERATPSQTLVSVCWTGTSFVAVGPDLYGNSVAYRSTDGVTWSSTTLPGAGAADAYYCVAGGFGRVVAMGLAAAAAYSDDNGATWTQITLPSQPDGGARAIRSIVWTGSVFVAVQDSSGVGAVYTSRDGVNWTNAWCAMPNPNGYTAIGWSGSGLLCAGPSSVATSLINGP